MLAFTTDELIKAIRSDLDDKTTAADGSDFGCLWSDADLYRYLTGACDALAKKLGVLYKTLRTLVPAQHIELLQRRESTGNLPAAGEDPA